MNPYFLLTLQNKRFQATHLNDATIAHFSESELPAALHTSTKAAEVFLLS